MSRRLGRSLLVPIIAALAAGDVIGAFASGPTKSKSETPGGTVVLQRFLTNPDPDPTDFRVMRRIDARSERFGQSAWMDVWTEVDRHGFRYRIAAEGGSEYIRSKVFRASLETERKMWADGSPARAALTSANYTFEEAGAQPDGLASFTLKPRRKDDLLIDGSIYVDPDDGDLVRLEGRLVKNPSFWTRKVEIVRKYQRFAGVRMPTALESVAHILIAGKSTFRLTYEYETVNGQRFGSPKARVQQADTAPQ
jgi:hypothetical protein